MQEAFSLANLERSHDLSSRASSRWLSGACPGFGAITLPLFQRAYLPWARGELRKCNAKASGVWHTSAPEGLLDLQSDTAARRVSLCNRGDSQRVAHGGAEPRSTASPIEQAGEHGGPESPLVRTGVALENPLARAEADPASDTRRCQLGSAAQHCIAEGTRR